MRYWFRWCLESRLLLQLSHLDGQQSKFKSTPADDLLHPVQLTYFNRPKRQLTAPAMRLESLRTQSTGPAISITELMGKCVILGASVSLLEEEQAADGIGVKPAAESSLSRR